MKKSMWVLMIALGAVVTVAVVSASGDDNDGGRHLRARLRAGNEVPAVISDARGEFKAKVDWENQTIEYELSYEGLEGAVTQSHIHVGQPFASGGIMIWLCANNPPITTAPDGTQACPGPMAGTITGTITPANVVGPAATQAVPVGSFADAVAAIRSGNAYVNVHTTSAGPGEIRGQIK